MASGPPALPAETLSLGSCSRASLPETRYQQLARDHPRKSDGHRPADLDDLFRWQSEVVGQVRGVTLHKREQRLDPARQGLGVAARHDSLVPDIVGDIGQVDRAAAFMGLS